MSLYPIDQVMGAADTTRITSVPRDYRWLTIMNSTSWLVKVYRGTSTAIENLVGQASMYTNVTIPLTANDGTFTLDWSGGSATEKTTLIFSDTNLGINQTLIPPGGAAFLILKDDEVGLTKATQLPVALTAGGNLKVALMELLSQLPLTLTAGGNLKTAIQEAVALVISNLPADLHVSGGVKTAIVSSVAQSLSASELKPAGVPSVVRVAIGALEVPVAIPDTTRRFVVRAAGGDVKIAYASGGDVVTIPSGTEYRETDLKTAGLTLYVQTGAAGPYAEIISWT